MKWLYVSRQFNRSGYMILEHLLREGIHIPAAVLLTSGQPNNPLDDPALAGAEIERYQHEVARYHGRPLRFMQSIRLLAEQHGIPVLEKDTIKSDESYHWLHSAAFDLIALGGGWPELFPERIIQLPPLGVINTHPSLLPAFRGTDVHRWQVLHGVRRSGTTIHSIEAQFDTGPILGQAAVEIEPADTPQDLAAKTGKIAAPLMSSVLTQIFQAAPARLTGIPQPASDDSNQPFHRWRWKDRAFLQIDWTRPAPDLARLVLACTQESYRYNGPYFSHHNQTYIVREAEAVPLDGPGSPGDLLVAGSEVLVRCAPGSGALRLAQVQPIQMRDWETYTHSAPAAPAGQVFQHLYAENWHNPISLLTRGT